MLKVKVLINISNNFIVSLRRLILVVQRPPGRKEGEKNILRTFDVSKPWLRKNKLILKEAAVNFKSDFPQLKPRGA